MDEQTRARLRELGRKAGEYAREQTMKNLEREAQDRREFVEEMEKEIQGAMDSLTPLLLKLKAMKGKK